jgi:hypothetical protein
MLEGSPEFTLVEVSRALPLFSPRGYMVLAKVLSSQSVADLQ